MPKYTNKYGIPLPDFIALTSDDYVTEPGTLSITSLIKPPRIRLLAKRHDDDIEIDASSLVKRGIGTAVHSWVESKAVGGEGFTLERRLKYNINGRIITGQYDIEEENPHTIWDRKTTSTWAYIFGAKDEWRQQLNGYRWLRARQGDGREAQRLAVIAWFTDWSEAGSLRNGAGYPPADIAPIEIDVDPIEQTERFFLYRAEMHANCEDLPDDELPLCTPEERWCRDAAWAVHRRDGVKHSASALRGGLFSDKDGGTNDDAIKFAAQQKFPCVIIRREGTSKRCNPKYCQAAKFCEFYQRTQNGFSEDTQEDRADPQ